MSRKKKRKTQCLEPILQITDQHLQISDQNLQIKEMIQM